MLGQTWHPVVTAHNGWHAWRLSTRTTMVGQTKGWMNEGGSRTEHADGMVLGNQTYQKGKKKKHKINGNLHEEIQRQRSQGGGTDPDVRRTRVVCANAVS